MDGRLLRVLKPGNESFLINMNIVEALRTGKPLRRPINRHWGSNKTGWLGNDYVIDLLIHNEGTSLFFNYSKPQLIIKKDLLAEDWEVKS